MIDHSTNTEIFDIKEINSTEDLVDALCNIARVIREHEPSLPIEFLNDVAALEHSITPHRSTLN